MRATISAEDSSSISMPSSKRCPMSRLETTASGKVLAVERIEMDDFKGNPAG
jgi:hypothetical protein